jgi:hypothetical protein
VAEFFFDLASQISEVITLICHIVSIGSASAGRNCFHRAVPCQ